METRLWTVMLSPKCRSGEAPERFRPVTDRFRFWAFLLPPFWAAWSGLWVALAVVLGISYATGALLPQLHGGVAWFAVMLLFGWEGGAIARLDLWLRGWRAGGLVEAEREEGAAELWLEGAATPLDGAEDGPAGPGSTDSPGSPEEAPA